ncbi:hypothetical protein L1285_23260 [Pseudoalteromonas sp. DL2-H2.2]|uniref:hypothetical protein n=1 Tax=Pseudoalteromonas sp. DL2-H2.2 TaxID=2908889 RepID=UPI001F35D7F3|nr:hypothetical protein [Pseudoalteromonas sp. DL2-H2.2]MCF2911221.1 hypothetical protein [Pseudoalteromonas sp. DL2-H2.2]
MKFKLLSIGVFALLPTTALPQSLAGKLMISTPGQQYHFATSSGKALQHLVKQGELVLKGEPVISYQDSTHNHTKQVVADSEGIVTELSRGPLVSKGDLLAKLLSPTLLGTFEPASAINNTPSVLWLCDAGKAFKVKVSYESKSMLFITLQLNEYVTKVSDTFKGAKSTTLFTNREQCVDLLTKNEVLKKLP